MYSRSGSAAGSSRRARSCIVLLAACFACVAALLPAHAEETAADAELRALKQELVALNRELFLLEEELLFPASTQVAVYLSLDVGKYFALDAVELSIGRLPSISTRSASLTHCGAAGCIASTSETSRAVRTSWSQCSRDADRRVANIAGPPAWTSRKGSVRSNSNWS